MFLKALVEVLLILAGTVIAKLVVDVCFGTSTPFTEVLLLYVVVRVAIHDVMIDEERKNRQ